MKSCLVALTSLLAVNIAWSDGFESPGYQVGESIDGKAGWATSGAAVTEEMAKEGSQSVKLSGEAHATVAGSIQGIGFIDFEILPTFESESVSSFTIAGRKIEFLKKDSNGSLVLKSEQSEDGADVELAGFRLAADSNRANEWIRITSRIDTTKGKWDLYVDGVPMLFDQAIASSENIFEVRNFEGNILYFDDWKSVSDNPLFADADRDGMPDAEEIALGLNPYGDDRNGDLDGNGISNIEEYFNDNVSPEGRLFGGRRVSVVFVDNLRGSDANSGSVSYAGTAGQGPKGSIKGAMNAAPSGSLIVILKGQTPYKEDSLGVEGKRLTIRTVEPIVIK